VPFVLLSVLALVGHRAPGGVESSALLHPDVAGAVLVVMWNYMGWDNASTVAGEVDRPQRTYPVAVLCSVILVAATYVVPMLAMRVARVDASDWSTGAWVDAARSFGGRGLAVAVVCGGIVSAFGMYNALCLSYSRIPVVLAADGLLPAAFARLNARGAPWVSVLACSIAWALSLGLSFDRLVSLDVLLYGTSLMLEFVALAVLRVKQPHLDRPFRVPGGLGVVVSLGLGPLALLGFALAKNADDKLAGVNALVFSGAVVLLGPVVYLVLRRRAAARVA